MSIAVTYSVLETIKSIYAILEQAKRIVITTHDNPDGDAIGSILAFNEFARNLGIESKMIIHGSVPYNYTFLKGSNDIYKYDNSFDEYILNSDIIFVIDTNSLERTKSPSEIIRKSAAKKIVIDHHIDPKEFADLYFVDEDATSAGELVYQVIKNYPVISLTKDISESLYTAIMTDSGTFRFPRTDGNIHRIIADLIDFGADPVKIFEEVYCNKLPQAIKLFGIAFAGMELFFEGKLSVMTLNKGDFLKAGAVNEDVEDIVEESLKIGGVKVGVLLSEILDKDEIRVSFRSKGDISVRDIAAKFNGGGHFNAAGARFFNTPITKAKEVITSAVGQIL